MALWPWNKPKPSPAEMSRELREQALNRTASPPHNTPCERRLRIAGLRFADSTSVDESRRYATVVDVIGATAWFALPLDSVLTAARVVARTRLPGRVELFGPGLAYQRRALPNGEWAIDVYRLAVRGER